jgi:aspartate ammonia-lyase
MAQENMTVPVANGADDEAKKKTEAFYDFADRASRNLMQMVAAEKQNPMFIIPALQMIAEAFAFTNAENDQIRTQYLEGIVHAGQRAAEKWPDQFKLTRDDTIVVPAKEPIT